MGDVPREIGYRLEQGQYAVFEEGLRAKTDVRENASFNRSGDPRQTKVNLLTRQHLIHRERKWVAAYMRAGQWSTDKTGVVSAPVAGQFVQLDQANQDIVDFIDGERDNMAERTGVMPNTLIVGRSVLRAMRKNNLIKDAIKYTSVASVQLPILAQLLGLNQVLAPTVIHNRAVGEVFNVTRQRFVAREDYGFMFNKREMLLTYVEPTAGLNSLTAGIQIAWTGLLGGGAFNTSVNRGTWDYGEWFDVLQATQPQIVAPDLGTYYTNVVAA